MTCVYMYIYTQIYSEIVNKLINGCVNSPSRVRTLKISQKLSGIKYIFYSMLSITIKISKSTSFYYS